MLAFVSSACFLYPKSVLAAVSWLKHDLFFVNILPIEYCVIENRYEIRLFAEIARKRIPNLCCVDSSSWAFILRAVISLLLFSNKFLKFALSTAKRLARCWSSVSMEATPLRTKSKWWVIDEMLFWVFGLKLPGPPVTSGRDAHAFELLSLLPSFRSSEWCVCPEMYSLEYHVDQAW